MIAHMDIRFNQDSFDIAVITIRARSSVVRALHQKIRGPGGEYGWAHFRIFLIRRSENDDVWRMSRGGR